MESHMDSWDSFSSSTSPSKRIERWPSLWISNQWRSVFPWKDYRREDPIKNLWIYSVLIHLDIWHWRCTFGQRNFQAGMKSRLPRQTWWVPNKLTQLSWRPLPTIDSCLCGGDQDWRAASDPLSIDIQRSLLALLFAIFAESPIGCQAIRRWSGSSGLKSDCQCLKHSKPRPARSRDSGWVWVLFLDGIW
jgi:hypothetical protein